MKKAILLLAMIFVSTIATSTEVEDSVKLATIQGTKIVATPHRLRPLPPGEFDAALGMVEFHLYSVEQMVSDARNLLTSLRGKR